MDKHELKEKILKAISDRLDDFFDDRDIWRYGTLVLHLKMRDGSVSQIEVETKESMKIKEDSCVCAYKGYY